MVLTAQEQIEAALRGVQAADASLALSRVRLEGGWADVGGSGSARSVEQRPHDFGERD